MAVVFTYMLDQLRMCGQAIQKENGKPQRLQYATVICHVLSAHASNHTYMYAVQSTTRYYKYLKVVIFKAIYHQVSYM